MSKVAFWFIALGACVALTGAERPQPVLVVSENGPGTNWPEVMYFPDAQERPRPGKVLGRGYYVPATRDDVFFKLYTRRGPKDGEYLKIGDADQLRRSTFNRLQPTFFITHGFLSGIHSGTVQSIKDMYIGYKEGNVVAVDWSRVAANPLYFIVKRQTVPVGGIVAEFLDFLKTFGGVDLRTVHLVGHSLGAHVMGIAGKGFKKFPQKVGRITGLDPAGPLFSLAERDLRLDLYDAEFVDVIHTCGGWLGFSQPIGKVDFFPNGGTIRQPGCPMDYVMGGTCSHSRAWKFFAESINSFAFNSVLCASYRDYQNKNCNFQWRAPMGEPSPIRLIGTYFLNTAASPPYALG